MLLMAVLQKVEHWNKVMRAQGLREAPGFRVSFRIDEFQSLYLRRTKRACSSAVVELRHRVLAILQSVNDANCCVEKQICFQVGRMFAQQSCRVVELQITDCARVENKGQENTCGAQTAKERSSDAQAHHQFQSARWAVKDS